VLIVVQSTMTPGTINLTVTGTGLTPATLALTTVAQQTTPVVPGVQSMNAFRDQAGLLTCTHNPGGKNIRVGYRLDTPGAINLSVVSSSGRVVNCLTSKYHKAGTYSMEWDATGKSGVYFLVLKTNNNRMVRKAFFF
jgi:hypothetical protein